MALSGRTIYSWLAMAILGATCTALLAVAFTGSSSSPPVKETVEAPVRPAAEPEPDRSVVLPERPLDAFPGRLVAPHSGDQPNRLAALRMSYRADVRGTMTTVTLEQTFRNDTGATLQPVYQFPLPEKAAVYDMVVRTGDEVLQAKIETREEARRQFEKAKSEGRMAGLTEQARPNLFTQAVANLPPGETMRVTLRYVQSLRRVDGRYRLLLPFTIADRYTPGDMRHNELVPGSGDRHELPDAPQVTPDRVDVEVRIDAARPVADAESNTHPVEIARLSPTDLRVQLRPFERIALHDFEIEFDLQGDSPQAGLNAEYDPDTKSGYFNLLVEPPSELAEHDVLPREMVFVLDCSGSMRGEPLRASKAFVRRALEGLRPTDTFRIVRFSDRANEYSTRPRQATPDNVAAAAEYLDRLNSGGGTRMTSGIQQALAASPPEGSMRIVTFLTDGHIGNDFEIIRLVGANLGESRLYSIGVGRNVNRYLLKEMARMGRGFARFLDPSGDVERAAVLAEKLESPLLTDVEIVGEGLVDVTPSPIPDLFAGDSLRIAGRYTQPGAQRIVVKGRTPSGPVEIPVQVDLPGGPTDGDAVRLTWARQQIADRMHRLLKLDRPSEAKVLQKEVTELGLRHSLMTQWTSFVATSDRVVAPDATDQHRLRKVRDGSWSRGASRGFGFGGLGIAGRGRGGAGYGKGIGDLGDRRASVPKIVPGRPSVRGSLSKEIIRRVVRQHRREIKYCYERELQKDSELNGRVVTRFTIDDTGSVVSAVVESNNLGSKAVEQCMTTKMRRWVFPAPKGGGIVIVRYPFNFST